MKFLTVNGKFMRTSNGKLITVPDNYNNEPLKLNGKLLTFDGAVIGSKGAQTKLATPQNVTVDGTTASWDEVENATSYELYVDGTSIGFTEGAAPFSVSWVMDSKNGTNTAGESGSISTLGDYGDTSTATFTCSGSTGTYTHTLTKVSGDSYCTATQSGNTITVNMGSGTQDYVTGKYTLIIKSGTESITYNISYGFYCLTGDTLITLDNGTQKRIDQLTLDDKVLSWNPDTMQLEADEITYTDSTENKKHTEYDVWTFSDGTIVKTVHRHRLYNVECQAMVYMDEWKIGEHAVNINDEYVELVGHENVKEEVRHYTLFTKNQNYFVNGLLSGNRHTKEVHL